ncbi:MAG: 1,4-dihydroxy-2-naphthoate octaprenyltransferase [Candidatus Kapabacteria bacterium]|nr:1,4-dihydroxy-2-naphthoate octaprenyltransferase [Candidatus Kapabacteria bacterium]
MVRNGPSKHLPQWQWWLRATRPATLPLSTLPTAAGIAWAWRHGTLDWQAAVLTLTCAVLLQVLANFVNELGDYTRGADTPARLGPPRAVAVGAISPQAMAQASWILSGVIFLLGMLLVIRVGWWLLVVGLAALALAWLYTTGSRPLAYIGLGEGTAFVFFGIVPAAGAYAVQRGMVAIEPVISGIACGAFAAAVLGINNLRDLPIDRACGKRTLAVRLGPTAMVRLLHGLLAVPYAVAIGLSFVLPLASMAVVSMPMVWSVGLQLRAAENAATYTQLLLRTVLAATVYGVLLIGAIVLSVS